MHCRYCFIIIFQRSYSPVATSKQHQEAFNPNSFIDVKKKKSGGNNGGTKNFTFLVKPKTPYRPKAKQSTNGTSNSPKTTPFVGANKASTLGYKESQQDIKILEGKLVLVDDDGKPLKKDDDGKFFGFKIDGCCSIYVIVMDDLLENDYLYHDNPLCHLEGFESLVLCDMAMSVWERVYSWWKIGNVNAFSIDELFSFNENVNIPSHSSSLWQAVIWTSGYYIWKERNFRVFKKKVSSINKIVQEIQLKSYEWIVRRSKKKIMMNWQHWLLDPIRCQLQQ
ncbi:hypothetical protein Tco_0003034 [Tanacetum coccineum]